MNPLAKMILSALLVASTFSSIAKPAQAADSPFAGEWMLTLPTGEAGWLGVHEENGALVGDLMWAVGHAIRIADAKFENDTLSFNLRELGNQHRVSLRFTGERVQGSAQSVSKEGSTANGTISGKRQPPMPPRPDLDKVRFGEPIVLFNGRDLSGWRPNEPRRVSGWNVRDGLLANDTPRTNQGGHGDQANLRTDREFEDFRLHIEFRFPPGGGNSGVYLRGLYEIQTTDSTSRAAGDRGAGAVYGRIKPTENASLPPGEWQSYDLTLVDRHITLVYNGKKVIDNQPVIGCTGGALSSDVTKSGPLYLQGDHTTIEYRNIKLAPVVK